MCDPDCMTSRETGELARVREENQLLRAQLEESQELLRAIREGAVDALVIDTPHGQRVFTLQGADHTYRALIEQMQEGAVTLTPGGIIHYCNQSFADMLKLPLERLMGGRMEDFVLPADRALLAAMLTEGGGRGELVLMAGDATEMPALVSVVSLVADGPAAVCLVVADLTDRKRHEAEIRQLNAELEERVVERTAQLTATKDLLAVTVASIGDGVIVTDAKGQVTFLNAEAERLTGWTSDEAQGRPLPDIFHIIDEYTRQPVEGPVEQVLRLGTVVGMANHTILIAKDGRETPIDDSGAPIRRSDGTVQGVVLVFRDFTEEKQAEKTLRDSETRLRATLRSAVDEIWIVDTQGRIVSLSDSVMNNLGIRSDKWADVEAALNQLEILRPDGTPRPKEDSILLRALRGEVIRNEGEMIRNLATGQLRSREVSGTPIHDAEGRTIGAVAVVRDITERRRAEEALRENEMRLRLAQESASVGIWDWKVETGALEFTPELNKLYGLPAGTIKTYQDWRDRVHPADIGMIEARRDEAIVNREPFDLEFRGCHASGEYRWISTKGGAVYDEAGKAIRVFGVNIDITDRKRAEEELYRAKAVAEAANEAKSQFLANISHELRTPMNAILGMVDLALPKQSDSTATDFLQTARTSADLLLTLLNDLLDSAKIEAGKLELESAPFNLRHVLDQTTQVLGVRASEKGLSFSCRIPPEVPNALVGDQVRLRQIFLNLAGNGIKFTEKGEVTISGRVESQDAAEVCLEFSVRDTGIGIPQSDQEHIFHPFTQADASTTRRFGGTGLGLSICSRLVAMMRGRIWVESEVGKGSTFHFTVRLPLATEVPPEPETPVNISRAAASTLRILLAEDNPANQKLAAYILQDRGHTVEIVGDGQQALSMAQQNHYDVILMDVQMPGMDGLEATKTLRAQEAGQRRVPIVAMTAHAMKGDRERCLAAGMDGYLSKPIDGYAMITLVENLASDRAALPAPIPRENPPAAEIYDPALALKRCCHNAQMVRDMIAYFFADVDRLLPQMRSALQQGNLAEVGRLGHRLKGTVVYLGAEPATEAALVVERFCTSGGEPADAEEAVGALEKECILLKQALSTASARDSERASQGDSL